MHVENYPNPLLDPEFTLCSLNCEPLIPKVAAAAGLPEAPRGDSWYGEGGPGLYQLGLEAPDEDHPTEVFFFCRTRITREESARRFLTSSAVSPDQRLVVTSVEGFSGAFKASLQGSHPGPVHFVQAKADPWFTAACPEDEMEVVPVCPECHAPIEGHKDCVPCDPEYARALREHFAQLRRPQ